MLIACGSSAQAEVVATCGASKGWGYYVPGGLNPDQKPELVQDAILKGSFQLIRSGDDFDIIATDASGGTFSAKADGGKVIGATTQEGNIVVHVFYKVTAETYIFWLATRDPTVSYSQAKFSAGIPKHSLMVATCHRGI